MWPAKMSLRRKPVQAETNNPIVRITNILPGHVFFARTANHSTKSMAQGAKYPATFTVPGAMETGPGMLVFIVNGIALNAGANKVD
jgi:hypothetical protein